MNVRFNPSAKRDKDTGMIRINATVDGRPIECRAPHGVVIALDDHIEKCRLKSTSDPDKLARFLHLYWKRKIESGTFDDDTRTVVTLSEEDLIDFITPTPA